MLVTHEPDVAQFARRIVVFKDGKIRHDDAVAKRPRAADVLKSMPAIDEELNFGDLSVLAIFAITYWGQYGFSERF